MKILLVDDHVLFRDGLLLVLEGLNIEIDALEAGSYESARKLMLEQPDIDMVLLDLGLPGVSHLEALTAITQQLPKAKIIILSGTENHQMVESALHSGAVGYIPKSSSAAIMLNAMQLVISGGTYVPPQILQKKQQEIGSIKSDCVSEHQLTPRQYDTLRHLASGKSNKKIAEALNLSESTVRAHVAAILRSFNVPNRTHAVEYARKNGWL